MKGIKIYYIAMALMKITSLMKLMIFRTTKGKVQEKIKSKKNRKAKINNWTNKVMKNNQNHRITLIINKSKWMDKKIQTLRFRIGCNKTNAKRKELLKRKTKNKDRRIIFKRVSINNYQIRMATGLCNLSRHHNHFNSRCVKSNRK
jgi:hypothetical protein